MKRLALALLLAACAGRDLGGYDQDTTWTRSLRATATEAWADVGVEAPTDYALAVLPPGEFEDLCEVPDGEVAFSCAFQDERVIFILAALPEQMHSAVIHETGHLIRGRDGHLDCGKGFGRDVMCTHGAPVGTLPTERDAAFVSHL